MFTWSLSAATALGGEHTQEVQRERDVRLAEHVLHNAHDGHQNWPLSLVTEVYLFGSPARALAQHDLDIDVEHENDD